MKLLVALLSLAALTLIGCAGPIRGPSAHVTGVRLVEETREGTRVEITVSLDNPNRVPLPLTKSDCSINVAGGGTYSAADHPACTLPADGHQDVVIPAVFAANHTLRGAGYSIQGSMTYEPPGPIRKLMTQSMIPLPATPFAAAGKLQ